MWQSWWIARLGWNASKGFAVSPPHLPCAEPTVVVVSLSTRSLSYLDTHGWLGLAANRVVVRWPPPSVR